MGNRRLGRKRLYAVNKAGQTSANTEGAGMLGAVKNYVRREGHRIITEIVVDLGSSAATIKSINTAGDIIGIDGTDGAYIGQLTAAENGYITNITMACLELPATGDDDIMLYSNAHSTGAFSDAIGEMSATKIIDPEGAWSLGEVDGLESALTNPPAQALKDTTPLALMTSDWKINTCISLVMVIRLALILLVSSLLLSKVTLPLTICKSSLYDLRPSTFGWGVFII